MKSAVGGDVRQRLNTDIDPRRASARRHSTTRSVRDDQLVDDHVASDTLAVLEQLPARLRHRIDPHGDGRHGIPAWLRPTPGEKRIPVAIAVVAAAVLQLVLPDRLVLRPRPLLPVLELLLLIGLVAANPVRIERQHPALRLASLGLTALITIANAASAGLLVHALLTGNASNNATTLLGSGSAIYLTNIIAFALWYWEFDRGGPVERALATRPHPDFLFPQMDTPELSHDDWQPEFLDYLYVSFTNAVAFSPTDTMPLSRWAKTLMLVQSAIAIITIGLVIARAVNVLH
jgi:uncharacterized membrane protein